MPPRPSILAACVVCSACGPALNSDLSATLEPSGAALLAQLQDDTLQALTLLDPPQLVAVDGAATLTLALYRRSPDELRLRDLELGAPGRVLPWPERWLELRPGVVGWAEGRVEPPKWARTLLVGPLDSSSCVRWRGAPRPASAEIVAASRWAEDAVLISEVASSSIAALDLSGGRSELAGMLDIASQGADEIVTVGERDALVSTGSVLQRATGAQLKFYSGNYRSADAEGLRSLILREGPFTPGRPANTELITLTTGATTAVGSAPDGAERVWALGGGALFGYQSPSGDGVLEVSYMDALGRVGVRTAWGSTGLGRETRAAARVGDELWVAVERDDATTLLMAASLADVAVVSDPPPQLRWRWLAELDQARDVRTMITDGDGVLLVGAEGLTRYSPAAGECAVATDLEQVDVLAPLSPTRLFVAGQRGGVPHTLWLEAP
jgi:hypothetical protein